LDTWSLSAQSIEDIERIVVIPALAESKSLPNTLSDLEQQPPEILKRTLIICVINNRDPGDCDPDAIKDNLKTLDILRRRKTGLARLGIVDASSRGRELGPKAGVGTARKIGLDLGARLLLDGNLPDAPLISVDADCHVPPDFLSKIDDFFRERKRWAAIVEFGHLWDDLDPRNLRGILAYECFLRYHEMGVRFSGSPYAFPTIGSTISCTAEAYVTCGGMRHKNAGEDFYFLQELAKTGPVEFITDTLVHPSARLSNRVPFGTGKSMTAFMRDEEKFYRTYPPECYSVLKAWLDIVSKDPNRSPHELLATAGTIHPLLREFLTEKRFERSWERILKQAKTPEKRLRELHRWFDAFKTLKLIHFLRDNGLGTSPLFSSLSELLQHMGIEPPFPFADISPVDVEMQKKGLTFLRETMREMKR